MASATRVCSLAFPFQDAMELIPKRIRRRWSLQSFPRDRSRATKEQSVHSVVVLQRRTTVGFNQQNDVAQDSLRNCDLRGMACLDLDSMEGLLPIVMCRQGPKRCWRRTPSIISESTQRVGSPLRNFNKSWHSACHSRGRFSVNDKNTDCKSHEIPIWDRIRLSR